MKRLISMILVIAMLLNVTCAYAESWMVSYSVDDTVPEPVMTYSEYEAEEPSRPEKTYSEYEAEEPSKPVKIESEDYDMEPSKPVKTEAEDYDSEPSKPEKTYSEYEAEEPSKPVKTESEHEDLEPSKPVRTESTYEDPEVSEPVEEDTETEEFDVVVPKKTEEPAEEAEDYEEDCEHDFYSSTKIHYLLNDEYQHICYDTTTTYCQKCGVCLPDKTEKWEEPHHFKASGICRECKYQRECDHNNKRERVLSESDSEYYNKHYHFTEVFFEGYCASCGESLYEDTREDYYEHVIEGGRCTICNEQLYVIPEPEIEDEEDILPSEVTTKADTIVLHINDDIGYCDGNQVKWSVTPKLQNNKTMMPVKQLMEMIGGEFVEWNSESKSATFYVNGKYLTYTAGTRTVEGRDLPMKNPAKIVDNTMYVEITAVVTEAGYVPSFYDNYCVISKEDLAREVVHDYATTYYGADFSYKPPKISSAAMIQIKGRIQEFEYIISSTNTAYQNGTINKARLQEILKYVEKNVREYKEVLNGTRDLADVTEKESNYKAVSGSTGKVVEETQQQLLALGYTSQNLTGRYDDATFNNVLYFQITNGLKATGWLDSATVKAINKREAEVAEAKKQERQEWVAVEKPDNWDYIGKSVNQVIFGNYTEDVTLLGTGATIALSIAGVDAPMDVRDITADFVNLEWSWPHAGQTAIDIIALVPVVGALKHTDEVALLIKNGDKVYTTTKKAGEVAGLVGKHVDDVVDVGKHVAQYGEDFGKMGVYVKNPGIKVDWTLNIEHASNRMELRGLTKEMVDNIVDTGKALSQNNGQKVVYITKDVGAVVVDAITGRLVTVWSKVDYDENMIKVVKSLFGE